MRRRYTCVSEESLETGEIFEHWYRDEYDDETDSAPQTPQPSPLRSPRLRRRHHYIHRVNLETGEICDQWYIDEWDDETDSAPQTLQPSPRPSPRLRRRHNFCVRKVNLETGDFFEKWDFCEKWYIDAWDYETDSSPHTPQPSPLRSPRRQPRSCRKKEKTRKRKGGRNRQRRHSPSAAVLHNNTPPSSHPEPANTAAIAELKPKNSSTIPPASALHKVHSSSDKQAGAERRYPESAGPEGERVYTRSNQKQYQAK